MQTHTTDNFYVHGFAKIRINRTSLIEDYASNSKQNNGIYLDIFPYDYMPNNRIPQKLHYVLYKMVKWGALGKTDYNFVDNKKRDFSIGMSRFFFYTDRAKLLDIGINICKFFSSDCCLNVVNMSSAYKYTEYIKKENLLKMDTLLSEDYKFKVPRNYKQLLTHMYGDYQILPPIEERWKQHAILKVRTGDYKIQNNA